MSLYALIFGRKKKAKQNANGFVQRLYHPSGNMELHHKRKAIELFGLINNDEAEALRLFTIHEERLSFITMW